MEAQHSSHHNKYIGTAPPSGKGLEILVVVVVVGFVAVAEGPLPAVGVVSPPSLGYQSHTIPCIPPLPRSPSLSFGDLNRYLLLSPTSSQFSPILDLLGRDLFFSFSQG